MNFNSTFDNLTNDAPDFERQRFMVHLPKVIATLGITMILALVGNVTLAIIIVSKSKSCLSPIEILILHTCLSDILFALLTILPQMATFLTIPSFYGSEFFCRLIKYAQLIPLYASPYILVAISIDRYMAICRPLVSFRFKYSMTRYLALGAWTLSLIFSVPNFVTVSLEMKNDTAICLSTNDMNIEKVTVTFFALFAWVIPTIVASVLYTFVCLEVRKSSKLYAEFCPNESSQQISRNLLKKPCVEATSRSISTTSCSLRSRKRLAAMNQVRGKRLSYKMKTVKLTLTIVSCNFLLLAPFCMANCFETWFPDWSLDSIVTTCIMLVGNANSCVNPWIYLLFNYKRIFKALCPSRGFSPVTDRSNVKYGGHTSVCYNESAMVNNCVGCGHYNTCQQTSVISDCDSHRKKSSLLIYTAGETPSLCNDNGRQGTNSTLLATIRGLEQTELQDTSNYSNRNLIVKGIFRIR